MFKDIQSILPKSIARSGLGKKMDEAQVLEIFNEVADKIIPGDIRDTVRPLYLNSRILTIASLSGYATEILRKKEAETIKLINQKMTSQIVRKLNFLT